MATIKICDLCGKQCPEGEALQLRIQQTPIAFTFQTVDICNDCDEWLSRQLQDRAAALRTTKAEMAKEETEKHEEEPAHVEAGEH